MLFITSAAVAQPHATRSSAIGQRAAAAIQQRESETAIQHSEAGADERLRQQFPIMAMERRSETAIANNKHNLGVIDNVVGKALEILALAFGVALIVSSVIEQKERKQETASIVVGTFFILFGLICPPAIHAVCEFAARSLFH